MTRTRSLSTCAALLLALLSVPAHAGSPDDPEVRNEDCSPGTVQLGGESLPCTAWFTASKDATGAALLTGTVRWNGRQEQRPAPSRTTFVWQRTDGCREGWQLTDLLDAPDELRVLRVCNGVEVTALLDPARAEQEGTDTRVRLSGRDLARVGSSLAAGDRLARPVVGTRLLVRSETASVEVSTLGSDMGPGRDFVVPA